MIALIPNCAFLSETSRMLAIHDALRAAGEPVCVATHGGPWQGLLDRAGVRWVQLSPRMDPERCARFVRSLPGIGHPNQSMYSDEEMLASVESEAAFLREHEVRLAVTGFTLTTLLSTRVAGIPLAASHAGSFVPPVFEAGLLPAASRPPTRWLGWLPQALQRQLMNRFPARSLAYCSGFNRVAARLGVEGVPSFGALLLADLTLVTDVPELLGIPRDRLEAWRPSPGARYRPDTTLRYTGPLYARLDVPVPERVERFLGQGGAVAYVALTSTPPQLVRSVVAAVRAAGCRVLVAGTVHDLAALDGGAVMVEPLLPSHLVMPRVQLAVITGGQGSVQTAMASGAPMVGLPLQPEQDLNVHRCERQGMALRIAPRLTGGEAMTRAVRTLLDQPHYREQALRVRALVSHIDGAANAAAAIRRYLAQRSARNTNGNAALHTAARITAMESNHATDS